MRNGIKNILYKIAFTIIIIAVIGVFIATYYDNRAYTNDVYYEEIMREDFYKDVPEYQELQSDRERIDKLIREAEEIKIRLDKLNMEAEKKLGENK